MQLSVRFLTFNATIERNQTAPTPSELLYVLLFGGALAECTYGDDCRIARPFLQANAALLQTSNHTKSTASVDCKEPRKTTTTRLAHSANLVTSAVCSRKTISNVELILVQPRLEAKHRKGTGRETFSTEKSDSHNTDNRTKPAVLFVVPLFLSSLRKQINKMTYKTSPARISTRKVSPPSGAVISHPLPQSWPSGRVVPKIAV